MKLDGYRGLTGLFAAWALTACGDSTATPDETDDGSSSSGGSGETSSTPTSFTTTGAETTSAETTADETTTTGTVADTGSSTDGTETDTETDTDTDTDGRASCGDGMIDGGEECDDAGESETCNDDCTASACGDGVVNATAGEDCDDGAESETCDEDCTTATCGDGTINTTAGEECDGGDDCADDCSLLATYVSCAALLDANPGTTDGMYPLDPDQNGTTESVYCDMTTDGGGWTLVSSTRTTPVADQSMDYVDALQTINPDAATAGVWDGLRPVVGASSHVRFTCAQDPEAIDFDVDLSFYNVVWYDEFTTGTEAESCFSEADGAGADEPIPSRRNNLTGAALPVGDAWNAGYLEGEDSCDSTDFTVDFDDRGMDGNQSDGTDWGNDDGAAKCGTSGIDDGVWHIWVREAGPASCGNGIPEEGEACDDGGPTDSCTEACTAVVCGDGVVEGAEECDDEGESATCDLDCTAVTCGDGIVNVTAGEECDGGTLNCAADCTVDGATSSCLAILTADPMAIDGLYGLDPDSDGTTQAVYCDMTTDGGGWTLVSSSLDPVDDQAMDYSPALQSINPVTAISGVWDGMRPLVAATSDVRFTCLQDPAGAAFDVDLSFYDVVWYDEFTTGTDADSCFSENQGNGADAPPARRDNIADIDLLAGDQWNTGYLEGEDACAASDDFTVDFDDRGMDGNQSDGTDWGEDDGFAKCGASGVSDGAWHIWMRETGN